jgi:flagellar motor switch protein FliG
MIVLRPMDIDVAEYDSLREIQSDALIIALKGADWDLRERYSGICRAARRNASGRFGSHGARFGSVTWKLTKQILQVVRRLADEGQIVFGYQGEESYV